MRLNLQGKPGSLEKVNVIFEYQINYYELLCTSMSAHSFCLH